MLSRIENVYLAILRIVVLVVATVALIAAAFGLAFGFPALGGILGWSKPDAPFGGTLVEYIEAKRATVDSKETADANATVGTTRTLIDARVRDAAVIIQSYTKGEKGASKQKISNWEDEIISQGSALPSSLIDVYYDDNLALIAQLKASKGTKLSIDQIKELIAWNASEFSNDAAMKAGDFEAQQAESLSMLTLAAGAFLLFLMVIFTFLFVKVERSLRLVRTVREIAHVE